MMVMMMLMMMAAGANHGGNPRANHLAQGPPLLLLLSQFAPLRDHWSSTWPWWWIYKKMKPKFGNTTIHHFHHHHSTTTIPPPPPSNVLLCEPPAALIMRDQPCLGGTGFGGRWRNQRFLELFQKYSFTMKTKFSSLSSSCWPCCVRYTVCARQSEYTMHVVVFWVLLFDSILWTLPWNVLHCQLAFLSLWGHRGQ